MYNKEKRRLYNKELCGYILSYLFYMWWDIYLYRYNRKKED